MINEIITDFISNELNGHRKTNYYQLEVEQFDKFSKSQILKYLAETDKEKDFLNEQFEFIERQTLNWEQNIGESLSVEFIPTEDIIKKELVHFRFSAPLIMKNGELIIIKIIYQNSFMKNGLKGSDCIELFKLNEFGKWENTGHLFGTSI